MTVSVVIPTVRQRFLADTLASLCRQNTSEPFEVLVVENGERSEGTHSLVTGQARRAAERGVELQYHFLEKVGANAARNLGTTHARSPIIALTDDDCIVDEDWIDSIRRSHQEFPDAGCIGGRVSLDFHVLPPAWFVGPFRLMLAEIDWPADDSDEHLSVTDITNTCNRYLVTANLSYKRTMFERIGGFSEDMLQRADQLSRNDEILFLDGARQHGRPGFLFDRRVRVRHQIPEDRIQPSYLERKFRDLGVAEYAYQTRTKGYRRVAPPFGSETEALYNTLLQHELCTDATARLIDDARRTLSNEQLTRKFISHLLRCKLAYINALHDCIRGADPQSASRRPEPYPARGSNRPTARVDSPSGSIPPKQ